MIYLFDKSFEGLLSAVFDRFEYRHEVSRLLPADQAQQVLFEETHTVYSSSEKSERVWKGIQAKADAGWQRILYCAFLSELTEVHHTLFMVLVRLFAGQVNLDNYGDDAVLLLTQTAKKVEREKHRMKAFIRFEKSEDGMYFARIAPDFNVIPLIITFFKARYADQPWMIYDQKRLYGVLYDTDRVHHISKLPEELAGNILPHKPMQMDEDETLYATLWRDYFKSTNIEARKNPKLHRQHVPKRYWHLLTEKKIIWE
ncbi:hypothetical protein D3C72_1480640 [compost metagenome]